MVRLKTVLIFLILNFTALFLGGLFTGSGVTSDWYNNLNQAPWTPPGFVFGLAWTSIMICFAFYMSSLYQSLPKRKNMIRLFALQWILNVAWNPLFFYFQLTGIALLVIVILTIVIASFLIFFNGKNKFTNLLLLPYLIWIIIATSLNSYIFFYN